MATKEINLKKSLGLFRLTVFGVGTIIGAGIYSVISPTAAEAGTGIWLSFLLAAIAASFSALSYAELSSSLPSAGAEHNFLRKAFPHLPSAAFITGLFIAIHGVATLATVALTFSNYLSSFFPLPPILVSIALIALFTVINIVGLKEASWLNVGFTITQIAGLVALIIAGFWSSGFIERTGELLAAPKDWTTAFSGTAIVFFIYTGYEHMAALSEEAKRPGKDLWRAFLLALLITSAIYLAVVFAVLSLLDVASLSPSISPLKDAGARAWPPLGTAIGIAALLATANAVLSASISVSRIIFGMARAGDLPQALRKTTIKSKSPWVSALLVALVAGGFVLVGEIKFVASLSSLGATLVFAAVNLSVIALRFTDPSMNRPFRIPVSIGRIPIFPVFGVAVSLMIASQYSIAVYISFFSATVIGILGYWAVHKKRTNNLQIAKSAT